MTDADDAWGALSTGPLPLRGDAFRTRLASCADARAVVLACAERLAKADEASRRALGNVVALALAERTPAGESLDPRVDALLGLVPSFRGLNARLYGRVPPERLAMVLARVIAERPRNDEASAAHDLVAALHWAPEATPAFVAYLRSQKQLRRIDAGGDLAERFAAARAAVPRIEALADELLSKSVRRKDGAKSARALGPLEIVEVATIREPTDPRGLGAVHAAQLTRAFSQVRGEKKRASLDAVFATPLRDGAERFEARLYAVRGAGGTEPPRYELWTFAGDTGVVFVAGEDTPAGVDWMQGSFEASDAKGEALAVALESAAWREASARAEAAPTASPRSKASRAGAKGATRSRRR